MNLYKVTRLAAIAGLATAAACSKDSSTREYPPAAASQGGEATPSEPTNSDAAPRPTDGQIIAILTAIDTGEIQQAEIATGKATDPRVKQFARHMIDQHTESKQNGADLAAREHLSPTPSAQSEKLANGSQLMLGTLQEATSAAFDSTYLRGQVQQHQEALDLLRTQLEPAARNQALGKQLRTIQTMVQSHLVEAQQILPSLATGSQTQPTQVAPQDQTAPVP
jgi:putative membrane protein